MSSSPGYNILIVDDSLTTRAFLRRAITMTGILTQNIYDAPDGRKALELMEEQRMDIVLADLHMPEMGGDEMIRRILRSPAHKDVSVIIISADPNEQRIEELLEQGAKGYLPKPFTPESLRKALSHAVGGAEQ